MKRFAWLVALLSVALVGCSGPHVAVDPEWKEAPARFTVLSTMPYASNEDDVLDDFGSQDDFRHWFADYLDTSLVISSPLSHSVKIIDDGAVETVPMKLRDVLVKIPLPVVAKLEGVEGVILVVHPVMFSRYISPCPGGGCLNNKHLNLHVAYSVVSVADGRILAYGIAATDDSYSFAMTRGNWEKVVERISWKLVEGTPLEK